MHKPFVARINDSLVPARAGSPLVVDLFAGCGGLALGFEARGFSTVGFEIDAQCCATYRRNLHGECRHVLLTPETDLPQAKVVIGGPPCQPFSVGGLQLGLGDARNGFPTFLSAVRRLQPDLWLFENVRGMLYSNRAYFDEITTTLRSLNYIVEFRLLNAVNHGVPQNRERVIVVGHRGEFRWPQPETGKVTVAEALGEMMTDAPPESKFFTPSMDAYVARYERASFCVRPRDLHPDTPARTLTCRNLAGATGDMHRIRLPDGRRRRLLLKEAARLQSFPDWFQFEGTETDCFNQVGNAVAPLFAWHLAGSVREYLESSLRFNSSEILYRNLPDQYSLPLIMSETAPESIPQIVKCIGKKREARRVTNEALYILSRLGVPLEGISERNLELMAMCFLAVADVEKSSNWKDAKAHDGKRAPRSRDIIKYINKHFGENISSGSYDDIRRKHLVLPVAGGILLRSANNPNAARNSPTRGYALDPAHAEIIRTFGTDAWAASVEEFLAERETLDDQLNRARDLETIAVTLPGGVVLKFSPGEHNELQQAVIEHFLPRYGNGAEVLYVGDAADKFLHLDAQRLRELNFFEIAHGELPDVIAYSATKNWLYLIEAVHSFGPISATRLRELQRLTVDCKAEVIYVTAFADRTTFRKFAPKIAWETEVWIADSPDHLVHFDGQRFLGPYPRSVGESVT
jgi:site-specific DNA-cytosine methylase